MIYEISDILQKTIGTQKRFTCRQRDQIMQFFKVAQVTKVIFGLF